MKRSELVHPRMTLYAGRSGLNTHFHSVITIERNYPTSDSVNQQIDNWLPLAFGAVWGYVEPAAGSREDRRPEQVYASTSYSVTLFGYYPDVTITDRLIVNGVPHNITAISHDDTCTFTMLATETDPSHGQT